ncbi:MAG: hypothetical protein LH470_02080 [Lysobacter sp.]|nr:hypothetical protein [Lysobacter sp.]
MSHAVPKPQTIAPLASSGGRLALAIVHVLHGRMNTIVGARMAARPRRHGTAGWRASIFVRDLLQRHQWMRMGASRPERVFAMPNMLTALHALHQHWHLAYAPRVTLRLAAGDHAIATAAPPITSAPTRERDVPADGPRFMSTLIERVLNRSERTDTLRTIEHAIPMTLRHEPNAPAAVESRFATTPVPEGRVQRVFRKPDSSTAAKARVGSMADPPQSAAPPTRASQDAHANQSVSSSNAPQINIEHLADRVVHAIDRRLVAQRERYGRA